MKYCFRTAAIFAFLVFANVAAFQLPLVVAQNPGPVEIKIDPRLFDSYVGQYQAASDPEFIFSFFREADKFYGQVTDQRRFEIFPSSETKFFLKDLNAQVEFIRDAAGKVVSIVWHQGGRDKQRVG